MEECICETRDSDKSSVAPISFNRIKIGMGVQVDSVVQFVDKFTEQAIHQKTASLGEYEAKASSLSQLETIFNETKEQGLRQAMSDFWALVKISQNGQPPDSSQIDGSRVQRLMVIGPSMASITSSMVMKYT
jgi:flagellar hook-associated protein 1 FlgK